MSSAVTSTPEKSIDAPREFGVTPVKSYERYSPCVSSEAIFTCACALGDVIIVEAAPVKSWLYHTVAAETVIGTSPKLPTIAAAETAAMDFLKKLFILVFSPSNINFLLVRGYKQTIIIIPYN